MRRIFLSFLGLAFCLFPIAASVERNISVSSRLAVGDLSTDQVTQCYLTTEPCNSCQRECLTQNARNFFGGAASTSQAGSYPTVIADLHRCRIYNRKLRRGLPHWCVNDGTKYFATSGFVPSESTCTREPIACAKWLGKEADKNLRDRIWNQQTEFYVMAKKMEELATAKEDLIIETKETNKSKEKADEILKAWEGRWYDEATIHLENPEGNGTRFADPVFFNYTSVKKEVRQMDMEISNNDLYHANKRNKEIRKETMETIPIYLGSISGLQNHIKSRKARTDRYLQDIKEIANRTAHLQIEATNIIYETTHSKDLDGEITLLDHELLDLYADLKAERAKLYQANLNSTISKLRLVGMMRRLVKEISIQQSECPSNEQFGI
ncbi:hypothetical protein BWQ96_02075 [Gracilariopsis chorda]|uniref:Uncharacterized protein n=1 Tax=Gracilariopsis chorda TaxID=448386 RepID=A0A2V3J1D3_9FLOR|nr:hypothetical protein BWQ96_02075 [Gracilariopsis chorda]|eukprot:PXF48123.1 hypothetical protein BWQ96_02075 [Gracilariopsis chorda]